MKPRNKNESDRRKAGSSTLVVGGAGFIGSQFVEDYQKRFPQKEVLILDNFFLGNIKSFETREGVQANIIRADATDLSVLISTCENFNVREIYNFAVVPLPTSLQFPAWTTISNIKIATNICEVVRRINDIKLINISSSEVYGTLLEDPMSERHPMNPRTPYAGSKIAADKIVESYHTSFGIKTFTVRPFNNYGPGQNYREYPGLIPSLWNSYSRGLPIILHGDGNQTRDFVFVKDTIEAIIRLSELELENNEVVTVATGVETKIIDVVQMFLEIVNEVNYPIIREPVRFGDVSRHRGDITKLQQLIKFTPRAMKHELLAETVNWYRKELSWN
jgi:UDP-glucose 4-epimerase